MSNKSQWVAIILCVGVTIVNFVVLYAIYEDIDKIVKVIGAK